LGPSEEELAEFDKEFSKLMSESAADAKRVDRKAALSVWDSTALPGSGVGKRRKDDQAEQKNEEDKNIMKFTVLSKKGFKNPNRELAVPISSALAAHTRSAQLQDQQEQQLLKRLVLNYGEREEENEIRCEFPSTITCVVLTPSPSSTSQLQVAGLPRPLQWIATTSSQQLKPTSRHNFAL
jgi:regulator of nonsense transcripts 2